mmetsp:Transcript_41735/g.138803  ORF Transcript_41735/g.138803 Transcript_41735/m.138803 type:complete len:203 (+) Transcript_41735:61-669(+)
MESPPVLRDLGAPCDPDAALAPEAVEAVEEGTQPLYARRVADQPRVEPHREHPSLACRLGLGKQLVDGGAAEAEEVLRRREGAAGRKLGVVGAECVWKDEVRCDPPVRQGDLRPVWQLVVVRVTVVQEAAMLNQQPACALGRRRAAVPAARRRTEACRQAGDGLRDARPLLLLSHASMVLPAVAVAAHVEQPVRHARPHRRR